ncbi:hypothetical protein NDA13_003535 [Ustilago tritici]|nr:hypothetical protein NDA13_003535 [Ustilago tritici]
MTNGTEIGASFMQALFSHMASAHPEMLAHSPNFTSTQPPTSAQAESLCQAKRSQAETVGKHYLTVIPIVPTLGEALAPPLPTHLPVLNLAALTPGQATQHDLLKWRWIANKTRQCRIELEQYDDDIAGRKEAIIKFGEAMLVALFGQDWTAGMNARCKPSCVYMPDAGDDPYGYGRDYDYGYPYGGLWSKGYSKKVEEMFTHPSKPPPGTKLDGYDNKPKDGLRLSESAVKMLGKTPGDKTAKANKKEKEAEDNEDPSDSDELTDDDPTERHTNNPYFFNPYVEPHDIDYGLDSDDYDPEYGYYDGYAEKHSAAYNEAMFDALYAKSWGDERPFDTIFGGGMGSGWGAGMKKGKKQAKGKKKAKKNKKGTFVNAFVPYEENGWTDVYDINRANQANSSASAKAKSAPEEPTSAETSTPHKTNASIDPSTSKKPTMMTPAAKQTSLISSLGLTHTPTPASISSVGLNLASSQSPFSQGAFKSIPLPVISNRKHSLFSNANPSPVQISIKFDPTGAADKPELGKRKATGSSSSTEAGKVGTGSKPVKKKSASGAVAKEERLRANMTTGTVTGKLEGGKENLEAKGKKDKVKVNGKGVAKAKGVKPKQPRIKYEMVVYKKPYLPSTRPWRDCWHRRGYF